MDRREETAYTVSTRAGVTLVRGSVPVPQLVSLMSQAGESAVLSAHLARLAEATFAWGLLEDVASLEATLTAEILAANPGLTPLRRWIAVGQRGQSSDAIAAHLTGDVYAREPRAHPHDVGDLQRCVQLLDEVPELAERFREMATVSPVWARLVEAWPSLVATLREELGLQPSSAAVRCPRTSAALQGVLKEPAEGMLPGCRDEATGCDEAGLSEGTL